MWKIYHKSKNAGQSFEFWNGIWKNLDVKHAKEKSKNDYITEIFLKYFPKNGKILDAGCGIGHHVLNYKELGYEIEGIDFSHETIEKIKNYDINAPCRQGNILKIDSPDSFYECYYSLGVFEHFEAGPTKVIKEAKRILKKNGLFIINIPYENLFRRVKFNFLNFFCKLCRRMYINSNIGHIRKVDSYCVDNNLETSIVFHEYLHSKKEILNLLRSHGFRIEYFSPCSIIWGILEIPYMKRIYKLLHSVIHEENKSEEKFARNENTQKRNLIKEILIYEQRNSPLKSFFVSLFGFIFGNLFLVVCIKEQD